MSNRKQKKFSGEKIHKFCIDRWEFYKKQDGAYLPSKHDKQVLKMRQKSSAFLQEAVNIGLIK